MRYRAWIGALIMLLAGAGTPAAGAQRQKGEYIRLHVIAHSDHEADQAVKYLVRDAILTQYGEAFAESGDTGEAEHIISANLSGITATARKVLRENGMPYGAASEYGVFSFPTRQYGDALLPAGEYRALRVVLGDGAGANWWCVLFPPLCVYDASAEEEPEEPEAEAAEDEPELAAEDEEQQEKPKKERPKIKFKIVEWVRDIFS